MERILLVEPNYKNKYPPIGLMKISTYFKSKGSFVVFHKGLMPQIEVSSFNKVFITTLFTFDFRMCVETIRYYASIVGIDNVFVGGIAATIIPELFINEVPKLQILQGQLISSSMLGYNDNVNIDILELDYDILWDISYTYPAADSYFIYTSRGCPRKCSFCAVKTLEPKFLECQNIREQISNIDERFGIKKQLLVLDNNILYSKFLSKTVEVLEDIGFGVASNTIKKNSNMSYYLRSLWKRKKIGKHYDHLLERIKQEFIKLKFVRINSTDSEKLVVPLRYIKTNDDDSFISYLKDNEEYLKDFYSRYNYHKIKRYVDFNQGLDARLLTKDKATLLSRLAVKPCRIAFDDLETRIEYFNALDIAVDSGIRHFSNYLLYNYKESPEDLWTRLFLNVEYCQNRKEVLTLFSFPMKYASINHTDRSYIGQFWNKKYLKSINVILNVTNGVVAKEKDFFIRAFGRNADEFLEILTMPDDFIRYRDYFEQHNFIDKWRYLYRKLKEDEKQQLLNILSKATTETQSLDIPHNDGINAILQFYSIKKNMIEQNKLYYIRKFDSGKIIKYTGSDTPLRIRTLK